MKWMKNDKEGIHAKDVLMEMSNTYYRCHLYHCHWTGLAEGWSKWVKLLEGLMWMTLLNCTMFSSDILNNILGVPSECVHQGGVWPCKLSFSCWLQGGKHARGCGSNKWFFSCCIAVGGDISPAANFVETALGEYSKKANSLPKRVFLRRRDDNDLVIKVM